MNREDEMIREALKLDINASDELNNRVLRSVERKKRSYGFLRTAATVAACLIVLLGTVTIVDAATGGRLFNAVKKKFYRETYVYENGSNAIVEIVRRDGEDWEKITYIDENVILYRPISAEEAGYWLCLKVIDRRGYNCFITLDAEGDDASTQDMYYAIRGGFRGILAKYRDANEKKQILNGLHDAAAHSEIENVRKALSDLASDLERERKIFYKSLPGYYWGEEGNLIFFEDLTDLPVGDAAILVNTVDGREADWVVMVTIDDSLVVENSSSWIISSEKDYQDLVDSGIPIYDRRKAK